MEMSIHVQWATVIGSLGSESWPASIHVISMRGRRESSSQSCLMPGFGSLST